MNIIRRAGAVLTGMLLATAILLTIGPSAVAMPVDPGGGAAGPAPQPPDVAPHPPTPIITHHGSPLWVFAVVAVAAIAATLAAELLLLEARPTLRRRMAQA